MKIIKFGGSVITSKNDPLSLNSNVIIELAEEIRRYYLEFKDRVKLVIVHGGGSYGHPLVIECLKRFSTLTLECFAKVSYFMNLLNMYVLEALLSNEVPVVGIPPKAICKVSETLECDLTTVNQLMEAGLIPVLYGDVVLYNNGFKVLSGDDIVWMIAKEFNANAVIFLTDVDGVYDRNPKSFKDATLLTHVSLDEVLNRVEFWGVKDVTGGMLEKLRKAKELNVRGLRVYVVNGYKRGNLYNALRESNVLGSVIWV